MLCKFDDAPELPPCEWQALDCGEACEYCKFQVKDLLGKDPIEVIEVRTNSSAENEDDMLFGFCTWDGKELKGLDDDLYFLEEEIEDYEFTTKDDKLYLTYWIHSE